MKKIYLLFAVALLTITASAQNVILRLDNKYDVSIDGRKYSGNATIPNLDAGQHRVEVYEVKGGFMGIGKKRTLISSSSFELRNNDVMIDVDQNGQLRIDELGSNSSQDRRYDRTGNREYERNRDRDDDDRNRNYDKNTSKNGKGYGPYDNPGKGKKYGLYKNRNNSDVEDDRTERDQKNKSHKEHKGKSQKSSRGNSK